MWANRWIHTTDGGWPGRARERTGDSHNCRRLGGTRSGRGREFAQLTVAARNDGGVAEGFAELTVAARDGGGVGGDSVSRSLTSSAHLGE